MFFLTRKPRCHIRVGKHILPIDEDFDHFDRPSTLLKLRNSIKLNKMLKRELKIERALNKELCHMQSVCLGKLLETVDQCTKQVRGLEQLSESSREDILSSGEMGVSKNVPHIHSIVDCTLNDLADESTSEVIVISPETIEPNQVEVPIIRSPCRDLSIIFEEDESPNNTNKENKIFLLKTPDNRNQLKVARLAFQDLSNTPPKSVINAVSTSDHQEMESKQADVSLDNSFTVYQDS